MVWRSAGGKWRVISSGLGSGVFALQRGNTFEEGATVWKQDRRHRLTRW